MEKFLGRFVIDTSKDENLEAYMDDLDLPEEVRKVWRKPATLTRKDNGDGSYTNEFTPEGEPPCPAVTFRLGEPTAFTCSLTDSEVANTTTLEGKVLVDHWEGGSRKVTRSLTIEGDYLTLTFTAESGVKAKRYLKKVS